MSADDQQWMYFLVGQQEESTTVMKNLSTKACQLQRDSTEKYQDCPLLSVNQIDNKTDISLTYSSRQTDRQTDQVCTLC